MLDGSGRAVAEVAKGAGAERRVALPPGRYTVKKRLPDDSGLLVAPVSVAGGAPAVVDDARMDRVPLERDPQKGFSGSRWALVAGLGAQRFFDRAARDGLFPPATLGGLEVAVRDDLGRGLAWGIDAALGGGAGTLRMPGVEPIPVKFAELAGGASLWKDFLVGPVVLSAGARIGLIWLGRSFPAREELPSQTFFTVTPGLVGGAAWRFSPRLAAVARMRLSYLIYAVDEDRSLGFAEGMLGVEYALGE
ncbi:hypothetical protein [Anaeromyxobacter sp. Fw109-5]|uniref:hypothetical protein n=1 Tax=Anaeromyxobacter sp. (strain Fw109-5) TaxID=404589 RepID=UPI000158A570|nr:hypothetical protein [Anaeromyxobacter sp. Fw109-5]ABS26205.1 hypothetical protein Anae109_2002 [Anaeromyxobacter sp. Fw109-5]